MSVASNTVPIAVRKKLDRICLWSGCHAPAKPPPDRSFYCATCHERVKEKSKRWQAKHRARLRRAKLCLDCTRPSGTKSRCRPCRIEHAQAERGRRGVDSELRGVDSVARTSPRTKLETHLDGYVRTRTTGRGARGQRPRSELDDELRRALSGSLADVQAVRDDGIARLRTQGVEDLGRVAKREAHSLVASRLLRAARQLAAVAEALCPGLAGEMREVAAET